MTLPKIKIEAKNIIDAQKAIEHLISDNCQNAITKLKVHKNHHSLNTNYEERREELNQAIYHIDQAILYLDQKHSLTPGN